MFSSGSRRNHSGTSSRVASPGLSSIAIQTTSEAIKKHVLIAPHDSSSPGWLTLHAAPLAADREQMSMSKPRPTALPEVGQQANLRDTRYIPRPGVSRQADDQASSASIPTHDSEPHQRNSTHVTCTSISSSPAHAFVSPREKSTILKPLKAVATSKHAPSPSLPPPPAINESSLSFLLPSHPNTAPPHTAMPPFDPVSHIHRPLATSSTSSNYSTHLAPPASTTPVSPVNHVDSPPRVVMPPSTPEHQHQYHSYQSMPHMDTPTIGDSNNYTLPRLTNEQQDVKPGPRSDQSSPAQVGHLSVPDDDSSGRKRSNPVMPTVDELNEGRHNVLIQHDGLPFGLRNKKMKPTDCLLYAATLLSKDNDDSNNGHVSAPIEATAGPTTGNGYRSASKTKTATSIVAIDKKNTGEDLTKPGEYDVLCGRGGLINKHVGNVVYRKVVEHNKPFYQSVHKKHRILVSQSIVQSIAKFGGRFLILGAKGKAWVEIGYKKAVQKTSQALRERTLPPDEAEEEDDGGEDDEGNEMDTAMESRRVHERK